MNNIYQIRLLDRPTPIQTRIEAEEYAVVPLGRSKRQTMTALSEMMIRKMTASATGSAQPSASGPT